MTPGHLYATSAAPCAHRTATRGNEPQLPFLELPRTLRVSGSFVPSEASNP